MPTLKHLFEELVKVEPELAQHLATIRRVAPDSAKVIARKLFADTMVPGIGNKMAYRDFLSRPRAGVHISLDANNFKHINDRFGHIEGDNAIKAMGGAIRRAARAHRLKSFRVGGDEFALHADSPDQAYGFARQLRSELEGLPPVGGIHHHSVSVGMGPSPEHAEQALMSAKAAKLATGALPGQAKSHFHSLVPGSMGPVPTENTSKLPGLLAPKKSP